MPNTLNNINTLFPVSGLAGSERPSMSMTENTNSIAGLGWKTVASKSLARVEKLFAPLHNYTTDFTNEVVNFPLGAAVTLSIEVMDEVGEAIRNETDWDKSAVVTHAVDIKCNRYSKPFLITSYDMAAGSRIEGKLEKAVEAVGRAVMADLHKQIQQADPEQILNMTLANFTPEYVATELSGEIIPEVTALVVNPTYHAKLTPYNADCLPLQPGAYGIGGIYRATGLEHLTSDGAAIGYMGYKNAIGIISRQPLIPTDGGAIFVSELGDIGGIKLYLKQWIKPGIEGIMHSVEAAVGSVVVFPENLRILTTASTAAEPESDDDEA